MMRKYVVPFVALMTAGAMALTACGSTAETPAPARASAPAGGEATAPTDGAAGGDVALLSGTAKSNRSEPNTGDWAVPNGGVASAAARQSSQRWVQLTASKADDLDPVVVNGAGLTLYRFDKDSNNPPTSTCNGECAQTWPAVTVAPRGKVFIAGVRKSAVGTVKRADGTLQVTIGGWPVYRFAKDTKRGDTLGQGVGGTWFGVTPTGGKAGAPQGGQDDNPDAGDATAPPATSAVFFDEANFSDNGASQGVSGSGCQNLPRPGAPSSVAAPGSLKIWAGPNCTGRVQVINGDVADLATIGFDNAVVSVRFS
ncbi:Predicted lipoprotein with conserved Yx(FWY)xxD motif [Micromonospora chokoriensis]|uniref:Predicted lipoprotein with conserved Yx(FWY)xxD motif n=2 Tax=Micromonospora chokoriensis TaxID=356851 RepID=A0A1C4XDF9_9ACTN|nr:Predicted lipoprotein with conserved Yx(FWY)xxD motif [Micromonospora chokoriensis]